MRLRALKRTPARYAIVVRSLVPLCVVGFAASIYAQDAPRVSATWQVERYEISVQLPTVEADRSIAAKAKVELRNVSGNSASSLTLRMNSSATVSNFAVNGNTVEFAKAQENAGSAAMQRISARIPAVAPNGAVSAVIDYKVVLKDNTGLASHSSTGSQFLPLSFWYPTPNSWYFARGADFAPTRIQVTGGQTVVSSGIDSGGTFDQRLYVQPFFVTGNWEKTSAAGVDVYIPRDSDPDTKLRAGEMAALFADARSYIANALGNLPDTPLRMVAVKRGGGFSSGGTVLFDEAVLRRSKIDSSTAMTIAEGAAKLCLADPLRLSGDASGVLREGLSRFFATEFIESKFGKGVADAERLRQRIAYSLVSQRDGPLVQAVPLDDFYYSAVSNKGAMIWRLLQRKVGADEFNKRLRSELQDKNVTLAEVRAAFADQKEFLDTMIDKPTDTNLMVGLPQQRTGETTAALRNTGSTDVTVIVTATLASGERMTAPATVRATSFGEVTFKTPQKVTRLEIDTEKLYPQTDYSDDVAPREATENDPLLSVKRAFDKQDFNGAEAVARNALRDHPNHDDLRILYARSLLGLNRNSDAEREFKLALDEKLPSSRTLAWGNLGLAETAARSNQNSQALKFAENAIRADAEYGASLAARNLRNKLGSASAVPDDIKAYFTNFDRVAAANRKTELEAAVLPGEASRFVSGISGQTTEWKTTPVHVDRLDPNTVLVETQMSVRLLNRENETGMAVYRLVRTGSGWKLYSVDIFEVR